MTSGPVRIAVLDDGSVGEEWASPMVRRAGELVRVSTVAEAFAADATYVLLRSDPAALPAIAAELAARPAGPPAAILIAPAGEPHPLLSLLSVLSAAKREWEGTFDAMIDPLAVVARDGTVRRANRALARAAALEVEKVVGRPYPEVLGRPEGGSPDLVAECLAEGRTLTAEARFDGIPGLRQVTVWPLPESSEQGAGSGVGVLLKDLTEERERQDRASRATRLADIGQLASGVAHEISTPLASIALRAESLLRKAQAPALVALEAFQDFPRHLKTIEEETFRCKRIIGALLEFSSSRAPVAERVDLNVLAGRAADLLHHEATRRQVTLTVRPAPVLPLVPAGDGQFRQVLIALLMNALEATPAGGHVVLETRRGDGEVSVVVSDDGAGMAPETRDRIFAPFFTTKPAGQGLGLGLSICHAIVTAQRGTIAVDSVSGRGTTVTVSLPIPA